jgi:hypothetical protein
VSSRASVQVLSNVSVSLNTWPCRRDHAATSPATSPPRFPAVATVGHVLARCRESVHVPKIGQRIHRSGTRSVSREQSTSRQIPACGIPRFGPYTGSATQTVVHVHSANPSQPAQILGAKTNDFGPAPAPSSTRKETEHRLPDSQYRNDQVRSWNRRAVVSRSVFVQWH